MLRRVAERDDLDAVAREFGLPADLVFGWLKDGAESGRMLGTRSPPRTSLPASASRPEKSRPLEWRSVLPYAVSLCGPMLLMLVVRPVQVRTSVEWLFAPLWFLIGCVVFFWMKRQADLEWEDRDVMVSPPARIGSGAGLLVLSIMSAGMFAIALPAIPHRFASRPVDVRTTIVAKTISGGKSTSYCFGTVAVPPVVDSVRACTDADTFRRARLGETIVLHGTASWVGFAVTRFELEPKVD